MIRAYSPIQKASNALGLVTFALAFSCLLAMTILL